MANNIIKDGWNGTRSIILSKVIIVTFGIILAVVIIGSYQIIEYLLGMSPATMFSEYAQYLLMAYLYLCSVPAYAVLFQLFTLLTRITRQDVFTAKNIFCLRLVSWCCIFVAFISVIVIPIWPSVALVALAAGLVGLILRIVKNVFEQAVRMKNELDYTI